MLKLSAFAALMALAIACSTAPEFSESSKEVFQINCSIEDFEAEAATKVVAAASGSGLVTGVTSVWSEGDQIGVFPSKGGDQVSFTAENGAGTGTCTFNGHGWGLITSARYSAYYPYNAANYGDADAYKGIGVSYAGQSQSAKNTFGVGAFDYLACTNAAPSFANAPSGTCTFSFKHLGALLIFDVKFPQAADLSRLDFICSGSLFTTAGTVDLSQDNPAITPTSQSNTLSLDLGGMSVAANETVRFYMMAGAANLIDESFSIKVTTSTGQELSKALDSSYNLKAGKAYSIGVQLDGPQPAEVLTVAQDNYSLKYAFSTVTLDVTSSKNYTISITSGSDWVKQSSLSRYHPSFEVNVNNTASSRTATILLQSTASDLTKTVTITQNCPPANVPIPVSHIMPCCRWNNYGTTFLVNNIWNSYHDYNDLIQCRSILKTIAAAGIRVVSVDFTNQAQWDSQWESDNFKGRLNNIAQVCGEIGLEWFLFIGNLSVSPGISYWNGIAERIWNSYAQLDHYHYKDGKPMLLIFMPGTNYNSAISSASAANKTYLKNGDKFTIGTCQVNSAITPKLTDGWGYRNQSQSSDGAVRFVCPNSGVPPQDWARINATSWSSRLDWGLQASRYVVIGSYDDTCDAIFWGIADVSASTTECHKHSETVNDPYIYYNLVKTKLLGE